jgi:cytidylate kinase
VIIAIDGPAGSGKTTVGRMVALALGLRVVDTGLFYRAVTVEALRREVDAADTEALAALTHSLHIELNTDPAAGAGAPLVWVDGHDVTLKALDPSIAHELSLVSQVPQVREILCEPQRQAGRQDAVVLGRDIGTVIFPNADYKFFFTASAEERLKRRRRELDKALGAPVSDALLEAEVDARDRADSERAIAPLRPAPDAIIVATEGKTVHQVYQEVMARLPASR